MSNKLDEVTDRQTISPVEFDPFKAFPPQLIVGYDTTGTMPLHAWSYEQLKEAYAAGHRAGMTRAHANDTPDPIEPLNQHSLALLMWMLSNERTKGLVGIADAGDIMGIPKDAVLPTLSSAINRSLITITDTEIFGGRWLMLHESLRPKETSDAK